MDENQSWFKGLFSAVQKIIIQRGRLVFSLYAKEAKQLNELSHPLSVNQMKHKYEKTVKVKNDEKLPYLHLVTKKYF